MKILQSRNATWEICFDKCTDILVRVLKHLKKFTAPFNLQNSEHNNSFTSEKQGENRQQRAAHFKKKRVVLLQVSYGLTKPSK